MSLLSPSIHIQTNSWLYRRIELDMAQPHRILGLILNLNYVNAAYIRSIIVLSVEHVANRLPVGTLEGLVRTLPELRIFR